MLIMNFEDVKDLSLDEQIKVLKEIKENFDKEKNLLKQKIILLEEDKKLQEKVVHKSISTLEQKAKVAETISSIKSIKNVLKGKDTELKLILNAIKNAEKLLEQKQKEFDKKKNDEEKEKEDEDFKEERRKYNELLEEIIKFREEREKRNELHHEEMSLNELLRNIKSNKLEEEVVTTEVSSIAKQKSQESVYKTQSDISANVQYSKQQAKSAEMKDYASPLESTTSTMYQKVEQHEEPDKIREIKYRINDVGFENLTKREKTQYETWREEMGLKKGKVSEYEKMDERG